MSYQVNWGFEENCDDYGKPLKSVRENDIDIHRKNEFVYSFSIPSSFWKTNFSYVITLTSDYEQESLQILSRYLYMQHTRNLQCVVTNVNEILILSKIDMIKDISLNIKNDLGLEVDIKKNDIYLQDNYRIEILYSYITNMLLDFNWVVSGSFADKNQKVFCKILDSKKHFMDVISIQNLTVSSSGSRLCNL